MNIHDLRNNTPPTQPYCLGDIVIYDNRPDMATVAQVRGNGNRQQLWLLNVVASDVAQNIIETGEWCMTCEATPASHTITRNCGSLFADLHLCEQCNQDALEREYDDIAADMQAARGAI